MIKSNLIGSITKGCEHFYILEHLNKKINKSLLYVARDDREIFQIKENLEWLLPNTTILVYRSWDQIPYDKVSPNIQIQSERIKTLYRLANEKKIFILLTSVNAILQKTVDIDFLKENILEIFQNKIISFDRLISQLISLGYQRTSIVREKGEFAVRGSLVDIYLIDKKNPLRIDFFDRKIDSIYEFDSLTQKRISKLNNIEIIINPSSEILLNDKTINQFRKSFRENFPEYRKSDFYISISERIVPAGGEQFIPLFYKSLTSLFSYCTEFDIILNSDFNHILDSRIENINDYYNARIETGELFILKPTKLYFSTDYIVKNLFKLSVFKLQDYKIPNAYNFDLKILPNLSSLKKEIDFKFIQKFFEINSKNRKIIICARSNGTLKRINKIILNHLLIRPIEIKDFADTKKSNERFYISVLKLENSVQYSNNIFINEKSIFGYNISNRHKPSKQKEIFFEEINKLSKNSILVHSVYGFCKFKDIKKIHINESLHDCIELEFANNQTLYLPVENLNFITKYGDTTDKTIQLDRLGSNTWQRRKSNTKNHIREIAEKLIQVAAKRLKLKAYPIFFDAQSYDKFCNSFPYVETEDQLKTIEDIKSDFLKQIPTDRLIVGDVAYGKSEIIIRAIFFAAKSSLQSILLVPTTLLARQHFYNFTQRLNPFGIKIKQLSRLITSKERKITINELKEGTIDVIIGTHSILNEEISFKKLGLIFIDEEQHFGVRAKEKLKILSPRAHFYSLSATPIPRTLSLSLSGIKELSLILTAPYERLSVRTFISPFDEFTITQSIRREIIGRKGGVFYVTPRKKDIPFIEKFLQNKLPDIKFVVAHGQLSPKVLEDRVSKFYEKKVPLMISTNIIESGLDLPHVNTIIIHRANMFSLAGIYQLKGRVGRSTKRGYAYLTYQENDLTENARKRLNIINSFEQLGSGFNIASQDLNIRGSGSIVGEEQSGFIKEVGTEFYYQLLEEEILQQKSEALDTKIIKRKILFQPIIKIPEKIFIPDDYINDLDVKISIYKRISSISTEEEKEIMIDEIIDRFGPLPLEVKNLFRLIEIKILCFINNIQKIDFGRKGILFEFYKNLPNNRNKLFELNLKFQQTKIKIRPDNKVFYDFKGCLTEDRFTLVKNIIRLIS